MASCIITILLAESISTMLVSLAVLLAHTFQAQQQKQASNVSKIESSRITRPRIPLHFVDRLVGPPIRMIRETNNVFRSA